MIPKDQWIWMGHASHFCAANYCRFHMSTKVGDTIVSTVGDYFPKGSESSERSTVGCDRYFETMTFKAKDRPEECGCFMPSRFTEKDFAGYQTAKEASDGHIEMCLKVAERQ